MSASGGCQALGGTHEAGGAGVAPEGSDQGPPGASGGLPGVQGMASVGGSGRPYQRIYHIKTSKESPPHWTTRQVMLPGPSVSFEVENCSRGFPSLVLHRPCRAPAHMCIHFPTPLLLSTSTRPYA